MFAVQPRVAKGWWSRLRRRRYINFHPLVLDKSPEMNFHATTRARELHRRNPRALDSRRIIQQRVQTHKRQWLRCIYDCLPAATTTAMMTKSTPRHIKRETDMYGILMWPLTLHPLSRCLSPRIRLLTLFENQALESCLLCYNSCELRRELIIIVGYKDLWHCSSCWHIIMYEPSKWSRWRQVSEREHMQHTLWKLQRNLVNVIYESLLICIRGNYIRFFDMQIFPSLLYRILTHVVSNRDWKSGVISGFCDDLQQFTD